MLGHRDQETVSTVLYIYGFLALALLITLPILLREERGCWMPCCIQVILDAVEFLKSTTSLPLNRSVSRYLLDLITLTCGVLTLKQQRIFFRSYVYQNNCSDRSMEV